MIYIKPEYIRHIIFTSNRFIAEERINQYKNRYKEDAILFYKKSPSTPMLNLRLKDGTDYLWLNPTFESCRGYRCSKADIDLNIPCDIIQERVLPLCLYCDEVDINYFNVWNVKKKAD